MQRLVILLLLLATAFAWGNNSPVKDVCVIGGGPSGLSAAVFAKDRGASVLVLERDDEYGGNCNTETFKGAPTGAPNYIDIGTAAFQNTALLRAINNDTWTIDSVAIAKRFAGNSSVVLLDLTNPASASPTYGADFAQGLNIGLLSSTPEQASAVGEALGRWLSIHKKYPWIEESKWVSPIPSELLLPFTTLIENYQLQPLVVGLFNQLLFGGGFSDYSQLTSLYALAAIKPALVYLLSVPNAGFSINGGCIKMYDGMVNYIGRSNVLTGVDVVRTERPPKGPRGNTYATVTYSSGKGSRCRFEEVRCKNLIIAFPQKLSTIQFLDPDWKETLAFKDFKYRYIYTLALNLTGPLASAPSGFTLLNFDVTKYGYVPATPAFAYIQRGLPYGPGSAPLISDRPLGPIELFLAFRAQTRNLPSELVTSVSILASDSHDQYQPYLEPSVLAQTVNPLKQIANLNAEGNRNTYWVSTALGTPDTVNSWQLSYNVVQRLSW